MKLNKTSKWVISLSLIGWLIVFFLIFNTQNAIHEDTQLQKTLKIFDEYKTLDEMFFYAEEQNALKEKEENK